MVALDADIAPRHASVVRPHVKLAGAHLCFPVRAPELVFEQLLAVEPMLDVRTVGDDARRVPLTSWLDDASGRRTASFFEPNVPADVRSLLRLAREARRQA